MSNYDDVNAPRIDTLYPHQAEFVRSFLKEEAPRHQLLIAPVQSGKSAACIALVRELIRTCSATHVLILVQSRLLGAQFRGRLPQAIETIPVVEMDRQVYRDLESNVPIGTSVWSNPIVAILTHDLALRDSMFEGLIRAKWDLVLVDEVHHFGESRAAKLRRLITSGAARRLLATTTSPEPHFELLSEMIEVRWPEMVRDWNGRAVSFAGPLRWNIIDFQRSEEEVSFLGELKRFVAGSDNPVASLLLRRASSSLLACEQSLRQLEYESYSEVGSEGAVDFANPFTESNENPSSSNGGGSPPSKEAFLHLLEMFDSISTDRKLEAFQEKLGELLSQSPEPRICVVTTYLDTASYLHAALMDTHWRVSTLTSAMTHHARVESWSRFKSAGQILVVTQALLEGSDFGDVDVLIHYDLPESRLAMMQRLALIRGLDRERRSEVFVFRDKSGAIPLEEELLIRHETSVSSVRHPAPVQPVK